MAADESCAQKLTSSRPAANKVAYAGYIREVVVDRKVCKVVTNMNVLRLLTQDCMLFSIENNRNYVR